MRYVLVMVLAVVASLSGLAQESGPDNGNGIVVRDGITTIDPPTVRRPGGYALGKMVPMDADILFTAGQVGVDLDGNYGETLEEQADLAMKNLYEVIKAAGMGPDNVLKMTMFYLNVEDISVIWAARQRVFGDDFRPGSTALVVKSLAGPHLLVEVEAIAAKVD